MRLEEKAVNFGRQRDEWIGLFGDSLRPRQAIALMYMLDMGPISTSTYARLNKCSQPTALTDLTEMVEMKLALREGSGRGTRYAAHPEFLQEDEPPSSAHDQK